jgi:hypothetical protein
VKELVARGIDVNYSYKHGREVIYGVRELCSDNVSDEVVVKILEILLSAEVPLEVKNVGVCLPFLSAAPKVKVVEWFLDHGISPEAAISEREGRIMKVMDVIRGLKDMGKEWAELYEKRCKQYEK